MRYQGGKSRIAKHVSLIISDAIASERERESNFVSLFCGSCSVESKVIADNKLCNDKHEYLIEMLKAVQNGYELPENISEEQYKLIKENKNNDKALTGFVGFGCSFGGKWFGGYARNKTNTNYALQSKRSLLKDMNGLTNTKFICMDYKDVLIPEGAIVYADPPYANTTGYSGEKFNSEEFWEYMRQIGKTHKVFISEQYAPDDFECVWEKIFTRTLDVNKHNQFKTVEKLFTYKGTKDK